MRLREISYLAIIVPITAVLGLWAVISYLDTINYSLKKLITFVVWVIVLLAVIITPTIATTYYLPKLSGENYVIDGMKWLGETGNLQEKVVGYGYRTVPIYTNMSDASYGLQNGYETRTFMNLLKGIYFSSGKTNVYDFRQYFGVGYILSSDKLAANLGSSSDKLVIDNNQDLDKIYSSKDFGVYGLIASSKQQNEEKIMAEGISLKEIGSSLQIETDVYKVVLNRDYPVLEQIGTPNSNYLGDGFIQNSVQISGIGQDDFGDPSGSFDESSTWVNSTIDQFILNNVRVTHEIINNQIVYRTVLKDQQNGGNEASLLVRYSFYPTTIKREFLISNDWVNSPFSSYMNVRFRTNLFVPLNDFIIINDQTQVKRHIYPSQDNVGINEIIQDLYVYDGDRGIYFKNEPTTVYPISLSYKGSTLYNMSGMSFVQSGALKPGATLHITQFLSPGDEVTARNNILTQERISLLNFPDGITPIILSGYRTPLSEKGTASAIVQGYDILHNEGVPYSEIVVPEQVTETPILTFHSIDMRTITNNSIKIIGSGSTRSNIFDDFTTQEQSISSLIESASNENVTLIGYMPDGLDYNLDTLIIISDKKIPFILSNPVGAQFSGSIGQVNRNPQIALYQSGVSNITLLPVSYPLSTSLSSRRDNSGTISSWKSTIDQAATEDGMVLFIFRSADIGNPDYSEDFKALIAQAKNQSMTFTTPDIIVNHFKKIQNVQYSGSITGDTATLDLTNNNDQIIQGVTFRLVLPALKNGIYKTSEGTIVKTKTDKDFVTVYVSIDIPAHDTKEIIVEPENPREKIVVTLPPQLIEGPITISVRDSEGNTLPSADVIIDSKYYHSDTKGDVIIDFARGNHTIQIQSPGYETYSAGLNVKGRIHWIEQFIGGNA